jgi:hypothetical protein
MGRKALLPFEGSLPQFFIEIKNQSSSARFEPANFGYNGKHANH